MIYLGWHPHVWWQYSILQSFMVLLACEFPCHQRSRYWCRHPAGGEQVLREKGCLSATPGHRSTLKAVMSPNLEGIFSASYNSSEMVLVTFCHVWFGPITVEGYCSWRKSGPMNVFLTKGDPSQCPAVFFFDIARVLGSSTHQWCWGIIKLVKYHFCGLLALVKTMGDKEMTPPKYLAIQNSELRNLSSQYRFKYHMIIHVDLFSKAKIICRCIVYAAQ